MLGLHWTPKGLGTDLRPKNGQIHGYSELDGKVVSSSYLTHQKVISYSWILPITRADSPLKSTSSATPFDHQNGQFHLRVTQPAAGSYFSHKSLQVGRNSFNGLVCHSAQLLIGRNSFLNFLSHAIFCWVTQVTWGSRAQVVSLSLISPTASQVSWRSVANVSRRLGHGCGSGVRVYGDRLMNGVQGSRARKSVVVWSQVTLITWPIIHFLFTHMSVAPRLRYKR